MSRPSETDESLHSPSGRPDWRESYYFNFVDSGLNVSGFSTIGLLPNVGKREFVFVLFHDGKREVYFVEPTGAVPKGHAESLSDGHLSYELISPLHEWRISFAGVDMTAELKWKARYPAYMFGTGSGTSWTGHFEQSGRVTGTIELAKGGPIKLKGLGERDKSWGTRDWHIEGWFALHAQFETFSIGLRRDMVKGEAHSSGGISSARKHVPVTDVELQTGFSRGESRMPIKAKTRVHGADGSCYTLQSKMISPSAFVRFSRPFPGGTTELYENMAVHKCQESGETGSGLLEWLFTHPETQGPAADQKTRPAP
ncbi:MAG: hypothetical protein C4K49_02735 [Candidatus Thorarchaeota archaeon]|nr:MAG: hypothetical protein C4K49_02735 [Candidatus Thorarchaeota archaeon]